MSTGATKWVWENSRASNGSLIVLLAIANECGEGEFTEMSIASLARKCRLSDRAVRMAVKDLEALGELSVESHRGGSSRYRLSATPAKSAGLPRQNLPDPPAKSAGPAKSAPRQNLPDPPREPQVSGTPAKSAGPQIPDVLDLGSVVSGRRSRTFSSSAMPTKAAKASPERPDVERLCEHLAGRIEANGSKRPNIGKAWRDAARLMLDNDGRTEQQVIAAIDWCQADDCWWRSRIMSMSKLREKYDTLRLQAAEEQKRKTRPARNGHQPTREEFDALRDNWARPLDDQEAGNDPRGNDQPHRVHGNHLPAAEDKPVIRSRLV
jgi:hypothetical protein